jgi:hypothetical protein
MVHRWQKLEVNVLNFYILSCIYGRGRERGEESGQGRERGRGLGRGQGRGRGRGKGQGRGRGQGRQRGRGRGNQYTKLFRVCFKENLDFILG